MKIGKIGFYIVLCCLVFAIFMKFIGDPESKDIKAIYWTLGVSGVGFVLMLIQMIKEAL